MILNTHAHLGVMHYSHVENWAYIRVDAKPDFHSINNTFLVSITYLRLQKLCIEAPRRYGFWSITINKRKEREKSIYVRGTNERIRIIGSM